MPEPRKGPLAKLSSGLIRFDFRILNGGTTSASNPIMPFLLFDLLAVATEIVRLLIFSHDLHLWAGAPLSAV